MQELSFPYTIIRSRKKSVVIRIKPDGEVRVHCPPNASETYIHEIVCKKAGWIEDKLHALKNQPPVIPFTEEELRALTEQAKEDFIPLVEYYATQVGVSFNRITIRRQKSRWGSCSAKGNLNFNCLLMLAPPKVRDYVIVHELCHLKQMNHSCKFWAEVKKIMPDYLMAKQWLKENGPALIRRLPQ